MSGKPAERAVECFGGPMPHGRASKPASGDPVPPFDAPSATIGVLAEVAIERARQDSKWGEQNHPDGTGPEARPLRAIGELLLGYSMAVSAPKLAAAGRRACQDNGSPENPDTWTAILLEEVFEALAEEDPAKLRAEMVQVAAVAVAWAEAIDRRTQAAALEQAQPLPVAAGLVCRHGWVVTDRVVDCPPNCDGLPPANPITEESSRG